MERKARVNRRDVLRAGMAVAVPWVVPGSVLGFQGAAAPSERITLGAIGFGGRGRSVFGSLAREPGVQGLAACDVIAQRLEPARQQGLAVYADFRELLARDDLDAVVVASPSQWKPLHSVAAASAGKDVFCEKPMCRTIREGRAMVRAVRRYERVFQHGTQQRSSSEFRVACEMVRSGRIGSLKRIEVYVGGPPRECSLPAEPLPEGLDWDMWLGPAPWRPFHSAICMRGCGGWEGYSDYSGGGMTGWGSHHFDIAQWALDADQTGPVEILPPGRGERGHLTFRYANGGLVEHMNQMGQWALVFEGSEGRVAVQRGRLQTWPESLKQEPLGPDAVHLYQSPGHTRDFVQAVRTRQRPVCDVEIGCRTMTVCLLGNLAWRLRRPLQWDPAAERFLGDEEANRLLHAAYREPWRLPEVEEYA